MADITMEELLQLPLGDLLELSDGSPVVMNAMDANGLKRSVLIVSGDDCELMKKLLDHLRPGEADEPNHNRS